MRILLSREQQIASLDRHIAVLQEWFDQNPDCLTTRLNLASMRGLRAMYEQGTDRPLPTPDPTERDR